MVRMRQHLPHRQYLLDSVVWPVLVCHWKFSLSFFSFDHSLVSYDHSLSLSPASILTNVVRKYFEMNVKCFKSSFYLIWMDFLFIPLKKFHAHTFQTNQVTKRKVSLMILQFDLCDFFAIQTFTSISASKKRIIFNFFLKFLLPFLAICYYFFFSEIHTHTRAHTQTNRLNNIAKRRK